MKKLLVIGFAVGLLWGCESTEPPEPIKNSENTIKIDIPESNIKTTGEGDQKKVSIDLDIPESGLTLSSPAFKDGDSIPKKYTCEGDNEIPPLDISGVPENTESLLLIMSNPDGEEGKFVHWTAWNISPKTKQILNKNIGQQALQGINNFEKIGYEGPCPDKGTTENYIFELWALNKTITQSVPEWTAGHLMINSYGYIVGKTVLKTSYSR